MLPGRRLYPGRTGWAAQSPERPGGAGRRRRGWPRPGRGCGAGPAALTRCPARRGDARRRPGAAGAAGAPGAAGPGLRRRQRFRRGRPGAAAARARPRLPPRLRLHPGGRRGLRRHRPQGVPAAAARADQPPLLAGKADPSPPPRALIPPWTPVPSLSPPRLPAGAAGAAGRAPQLDERTWLSASSPLTSREGKKSSTFSHSSMKRIFVQTNNFLFLLWPTQISGGALPFWGAFEEDGLNDREFFGQHGVLVQTQWASPEAGPAHVPHCSTSPCSTWTQQGAGVTRPVPPITPSGTAWCWAACGRKTEVMPTANGPVAGTWCLVMKRSYKMWDSSFRKKNQDVLDCQQVSVLCS